jgi:hypothetical protein
MTRRGVGACKSINRSHRGNRSLHTLVGPDVSPNRPQPKHARGVGCLLQGCRCQRSTPAPAAASAVPLACRHGLLADQVVDDAVKNLAEASSPSYLHGASNTKPGTPGNHRASSVQHTESLTRAHSQAWDKETQKPTLQSTTAMPSPTRV